MGRCEVALIKTDIDLKYEWQNKIHMQIMFLEKNTIMISEVDMRRLQVIPQKKNFEQFFPSIFLTNVCFKNYNKKI